MSAATESMTRRSALRPLGNWTVAVRMKSSWEDGARFWKKCWVPAPSGNRLRTQGRSKQPVSAPEETAR
jgi:hypothetical protein